MRSWGFAMFNLCSNLNDDHGTQRFTAAIVLALFSSTAQLLADEGSRRDLYGDRLPIGAIARLGTTRFRHTTPIRELFFLADGKSFLTQSNDSTVRMWNAVTGQIVHGFDLKTSSIDQMALSPDKAQLAIAGAERIEIYDLPSGKLVQRIQLRLGRIDRLQFSHDGTKIASHSRRHYTKPSTLLVHDTSTGHERLRLQDDFSSWRVNPAGFRAGRLAVCV